MPSTVAVLRNLTFQKNGAGSATDLQDFFRVWLELKAGGPDEAPEISGSDDPLVGADGQYTRPRRKRRLVILLEGFVAGEGADEDEMRSDTAIARQQLYSLFDVGAGIGTLSVDTEDGTTWTIPARPEAFIPDRDPPAPTHWGVSVRLVAVDPPEWEATGS